MRLPPRSLVVFGLVGVAATVVYLGTTLGLVRLSVSPAIANAVGLAVSLALSYCGHHRLTFAKQGDHPRYLLRFVATSALLGGASTGMTWVAVNLFGFAPSWVALGVAVAYPPSSYLLNALWTFHG